MPLVRCEECGRELSDQAKACPGCGHPLATGTGTDGSPPTVACVVSIAGGALLAISPMLAWVSMGAMSASGLEKTGNEALVLTIVGVLGALIPIVSLARKRALSALDPLFLGIAGGSLATYYLVRISQHIDSLGGGLLNPRVGSGLYVALGGALVLCIGALIAPRLREEGVVTDPKHRRILRYEFLVVGGAGLLGLVATFLPMVRSYGVSISLWDIANVEPESFFMSVSGYVIGLLVGVIGFFRPLLARRFASLAAGGFALSTMKMHQAFGEAIGGKLLVVGAVLGLLVTVVALLEVSSLRS